METLEKITEFCNSIIKERDRDERYFAFPPEDGNFSIITFIKGRWNINYRHIEEIKKEMENFPLATMYSYEVLLPYSINVIENIIGKLVSWPLYTDSLIQQDRKYFKNHPSLDLS
jgi:hypothetical protein